jgi:hypothetical protein
MLGALSVTLHQKLWFFCCIAWVIIYTTLKPAAYPLHHTTFSILSQYCTKNTGPSVMSNASRTLNENTITLCFGTCSVADETRREPNTGVNVRFAEQAVIDIETACIYP